MADDELLIPPEDEPPAPEELDAADEPPDPGEAEDSEEDAEAFSDSDDEEEAGDSEAVIVEEPTEPPLGRSWRFDFERERFVAPPGHGPVGTQGDETLRQWVEKCLRTARGAHPVHSDDYGMEEPTDLIGSGFDFVAQSELEERVRDALTVHPLVSDVTDFDAAADPDVDDGAAVSFTLVRNQGEPLVFEDVELA